MRSIHSTRAVLAALSLAIAAPALAQPPAAGFGEAPATSFTIFLRSVPIGSEQIAVARNADGWTITSAGRFGAPLDIVARHVEVRYTGDWKPLELSVDAVAKGVPQSLHTTISGTTATTSIIAGGKTQQKVDTIAPDAILLPSPFFGPFEALAARLKDLAPGATLPAYAAPYLSYEIRVGDSSTEQIQTPTTIVTMRHTHVTMMTPDLPLDADIWSDPAGRLLRISIPAQNLEVVREDLAAVSARRLTVSRPNDEQVHVSGNGFSLAGTVSKPFDVPAQPMPAIVLVAGSGQNDRDEVTAGIPVFGQLSSALADAGYLVIRYDKRGVGQSGGRLESAGLDDFAEDVRAVVKYLSDRKDVNDRKITVAGYGDGGAIALIAAAKDKRIDAVVLLASPGVRGSDLILQQQEQLLGASDLSAADKEAKIALQKQINEAVASGKGLDKLPPAIRKQVDTPWFQSFLNFDPAKAVADVRQPILIVQGELDTQVPPASADQLEAFARARKNAPPSDLVKLPGVNHLFVPAKTGDVQEYGSLKDKHISPELPATIVAWLQKTLK